MHKSQNILNLKKISFLIIACSEIMDQDLFAVHKQMLRKEFETDKVSFSPVTAGMEQIYSDDIQKLKQRHETKHKS